MSIQKTYADLLVATRRESARTVPPPGWLGPQGPYVEQFHAWHPVQRDPHGHVTTIGPQQLRLPRLGWPLGP
eukprot:scaffold360_cov192-Amphora_coffeaeformis.AAC.12